MWLVTDAHYRSWTLEFSSLVIYLEDRPRLARDKIEFYPAAAFMQQLYIKVGHVFSLSRIDLELIQPIPQ